MQATGEFQGRESWQSARSSVELSFFSSGRYWQPSKAWSALRAPNSGSRAGVLFQLGGAMTTPIVRSGNLDISAVLRTDIRYSTSDETFEPSFTVELPVAFAVGDDAGAIFAPFATAYFQDDALVRKQAGIRAALALPITAQQRLAVNLALSGNDRPFAAARSGIIADGAVSLTHSLTSNLNLTTTLHGIYNHTVDESLRTLELEASARVDAVTDGGLLLGLEGSIGQRYHWRPAPLVVGTDQVDTFVSARIDASHRDVTVGPFMPSIYYEYTNSWSDNVFYTYDSHDVGISLRTRF